MPKSGQKLRAGSLKGGKSEPSSRAKVGTGGRFKALTEKLSHEKGVTDPKGLAAAIGRARYGKSKMANMLAKGRKK